MTAVALSRMPQPRFGPCDAGLWTSAAAIILAVHVVAGYGLQRLSFADAQDGGSLPALAVELAPLPIAPVSADDAAMLDTLTPDQPDPIVEPTDKPVEAHPVTDPSPEPVVKEPEPVAEPPVETEKAEEIEQAEPAVQKMAALSGQQPLEEVVPDPLEAINPTVVVPLPEPRPVERNVKADRPIEAKKKVEKKPFDKPRERPKKEKTAPPRASITASIDAKAQGKAAAPKSTGAASRSGDSSKWNAQLRSWLGRHTRYPSAARSRRVEGAVNVTFVVGASGNVSSVRLARSSGDPDLDRAALGALQGATVPAPPPEKAGTSVTAPLYFYVQD
jgi:protein TonB